MIAGVAALREKIGDGMLDATNAENTIEGVMAFNDGGPTD